MLANHKKKTLTVVLVGMTFIACLALCEVTTRFLGLSKTWASYRNPHPTLRPETFNDRKLGRHRVPGLNIVNSSGKPFHTNSFGFRDDEWAASVPGEYSVAFLGDSVTEGFGVAKEERFTEKLPASLRSLNFGVAGSSTVDEFVILENDVFAHTPKMVFLQFGFNDIAQNVEQTSGTANVSQATRRAGFSAKSFLAAHSAFYLFLAEAYQTRMLVTGNSGASPILRNVLATTSQEWAPSFEYLSKVSKVCRARSVPLIVSYFPLQVEVLTKNADEAHVIENKLRPFIEQALGDSYFSTIDLLRSAGTKDLFLDDVHLNAAGNKLIAECLSPYLAKMAHIEFRARAE